MANRLIIHPRGFSRIIDSTGLSNAVPYDIQEVLRPHRIDEDSDIEAQLRKHLGQDEYSNWPTRRREVNLCSHIYGNFKNWVYFQLSRNAFVYDMTLDFLIDTLRFIATGERVMQPLVWKELLAVQPVPKPVEASPARIAQVQDLLNMINWTDFMSQWVSQPGGYDDMLFSTYVFFGKL